MTKTFIISRMVSLVCISILTQTALAAPNFTKATFLQTSCVTIITKGDMVLLLKEANPEQLALLSESSAEGKKKVAENLIQLLAIACQARKEGIANDRIVKRELESIQRILTATIYDRIINGGKSPAQPFHLITEERVNEFWDNKIHETDFQEFLDSKLAIAKESGRFPKDKVLTEEEIKQAKGDYAKVTIYEAEAKAKPSEIGEDIKRELELQIKLQQAQFLSEVYARKFLIEKAKVTDEEIKIHIVTHPEFNTKAQKTKALKILHRVKAGENFAGLADKFSNDPGNISTATQKRNGGLYVNLTAGQFIPEIEQAALSLKPGQIYSEIVETVYGYHIVKLERRIQTKGEDSQMKLIYDFRHILISTLIKDPNNPSSSPIPIKEYVRTKLEKDKEKKILDAIVENNPIEIEEFEVPKVSAKSKNDKQR